MGYSMMYDELLLMISLIIMTDGYVTSIVATQYIAGLVVGAGCLPSFGLLGSLWHDGLPRRGEVQAGSLSGAILVSMF
jgi:hypothetical protein